MFSMQGKEKNSGIDSVMEDFLYKQSRDFSPCWRPEERDLFPISIVMMEEKQDILLSDSQMLQVQCKNRIYDTGCPCFACSNTRAG